MDAATIASQPSIEIDWDAVVRRHSGRVFGLAYRLTGNRADAEDITQEVFVRALRAPGSAPRLHHGPDGPGGTDGRTEGWLHRVTTNLFYDLVRRRRRVADSPLEAHPGWEPPDVTADPGSLALLHLLDDDVEAALDSVPPVFREAVVLHDVHGFSYAEIGALVGAKPGTVRSRIHRGRTMLRTRLAHRAPAAGRARHGGPREAAQAPERS